VNPNHYRVAQVHLRRVASAARKRQRATAELYDAIVAARESAETYRDIGAAAGLSHPKIMSIVREARDHGEHVDH
jgi:hypothetical protein